MLITDLTLKFSVYVIGRHKYKFWRVKLQCHTEDAGKVTSKIKPNCVINYVLRGFSVMVHPKWVYYTNSIVFSEAYSSFYFQETKVLIKFVCRKCNDPVKELNLTHITFETCIANTDETRSSLLKEIITEKSSSMSLF